jgi:hypothetical protein
VVGLLLAYNAARFDRLFEFGLTYQNMGWFLWDDFKKYGLFHPYYILKNIYFTVLRSPFVSYIDLSAPTMGFSFFIQCPLFVFAISSFFYGIYRQFAFWVWASVLLVCVPIFLSIGTGCGQFGARYLNDIAPFLVLLMFLRNKWVLSARVVVAGVFGIAFNLYGTLCLLKIIPFK